MRKLLCLAASLFLCSSAFAANNDSLWVQLHSTHFVVITNAGDKQARHVAAQLETMAAVFTSLLPKADAETVSPIIVFALKDEKSFNALEPASALGKNKLGLAGVFLQEFNKNYILIRLDVGGDHKFATVYHEYTHYLLRHNTEIPLWLNEGLAEFYQNSEIKSDYANIGDASPDDILYLRQEHLLPLPVLLAVDHSSPYYHDEKKGSMFYSESWALTHYLFMNDIANHSHHLTEYLIETSKGADPVGAAGKAFGDLNKLQDELERYVSHSDFKMLRSGVGVEINEATYKVTPEPTMDADALRADIMTGDDRPAEAQTLLDAVLQADPTNALAAESLGDLKLQKGDLAGAQQAFAKAIQDHSSSFVVDYYFAALSLQLHVADPAEIQSALDRVLAVNPGFAPASDAMSQLLVSQHKDLPRALKLSIRAISLEPQNIAYRLNAVNLLMSQGQIEPALTVLAAAARVAKSPHDRANVDRVTASVKAYQATQHQSGSGVASPR